MDEKTIVGATIRELRKARGLSQDGLAAITGLEHSYISYIESGKRNPTLRSLHKISKALGVSMSELVREE